LNDSGHEFVATPKGIRFAMSGIKGVGEGVVEAILLERQKHGPFKSLFDFCRRIDTKKVGKKTIELLIEAGCFDFTGFSREGMIQVLDSLYETAVQRQKEISKGLIDLFADEEKDPEQTPILNQTKSRAHLLKREKELLGFYVTGHPLDEYKNIIQRLSCVPLSHIEKLEADTLFRAVFIIDDVQVRISAKNQKKFAILTISDGHLRFEVPIWSDLFEQKAELLVESQMVYAIMQIDRREEDLKLQCRWMDNLALADDKMVGECDHLLDQLKAQQKAAALREKKQGKKMQKNFNPSKVILQLDIQKIRLSHILNLKDIFRRYPGKAHLLIEFRSNEKSHGVLQVDHRWGVSPEKDLEIEIQRIPSFMSYVVQSEI
jgi:DNA polymerase-3 subunit alpha